MIYNKIKEKIHFLKKGYTKEDIYNLDTFIEKKLLEMLKEFKKVNIAHPCNLTPEEWDNILDRMIFLLSEMNENTCKHKIEYMHKCKDEFYDLLKEHHWNLWI